MPSTIVGLVKAALSHCVDVIARPAFVLALCRGLGANLSPEKRLTFAREVFGWAKITPPDVRQPLDCYYHEASGIFIYLHGFLLVREII